MLDLLSPSGYFTDENAEVILFSMITNLGAWVLGEAKHDVCALEELVKMSELSWI